MENLNLEQEKLLRENREHEAQMRQKDAERMEEHLQTMQNQLDKYQKATEENTHNGKSDIFQDVGSLIGGIVTEILPMGNLIGGLAKLF